MKPTLSEWWENATSEETSDLCHAAKVPPECGSMPLRKIDPRHLERLLKAYEDL
jgi:hypothetical protein